ncbi:MAG: tRNA pseudouridine(38-40) synthase TruA [Corynebacterium sp.]|nr:tRNA pseudouridine(38-40) synthase TruA [Corynebacterium sp.]
MTIRLRFDISYDGTDFHGWASQKDPETRTVQRVIENTLSLIAQAPIELVVAGRTDAGVHAAGQVAHADVPRSLIDNRPTNGDPARLITRLRKLLPPDIRISNIVEVSTNFDARFSALQRQYEYRLCHDPAGVYPLRARDTTYWPRPLDIDRMNAAAQRVIGLHDFAGFSKLREHATTVRELQVFRWRDISTDREPNLFVADVYADAFCWHMVRGLVGACIAVGEGRHEPEIMDTLLKAPKRTSLTPIADACGLSLVGVVYPPEDQWAERIAKTKARRDELE